MNFSVRLTINKPKLTIRWDGVPCSNSLLNIRETEVFSSPSSGRLGLSLTKK